MRRILTWALWQPRNLRIITAILAAVIVTILITNTTNNDNQPGSAGTATVTITATPNPSAPDSESPTSGQIQERDPTPQATKQKITDVARGFVTAWLTGPTATRTQWLTALGPTADPSLIPFLVNANRVAIPQATITTLDVTDFDTYSGEVIARLSDGSRIIIGLTNSPNGWHVLTVLPDDLDNP
ncbi:MAG: hypothetical protein ACRCYU_08145 [Nocardioides sp.]